MVHLRATKAFPYGAKELAAGDLFEATDDHAATLKAVGLAETTTITPEDLEAILPAGKLEQASRDASVDGGSKRGRREYSRRDMVAVR